ncbi:MAG: DUF4339 domain-containing protein [Planctomycetes bacterium]|nr:DUF4339 domain-containing protein [Planctomycetota bacterium]
MALFQKWCYALAGKTLGPYDADKIKGLVAQGKIPKTIPIWPAGDDPGKAVPADEVFIFSDLPNVPRSTPDWLGEPPPMEAGKMAQPPAAEAPAWLEDLRLWMGLEAYAADKQPRPAAAEDAAPSPPDATKTTPLPDWLDGWLTPPGQAAATTSQAPEPAPLPPEKPLAAAEIKASPPAESAPLARPVSLRSSAASELADQSVKETGFDLRTGRIVDAERFRQWKQRTSKGGPAISHDSLMEAFRAARTAIERWVDDDANRLRVLYADMTEIHKNAELRALFQQYAGYGRSLEQKLNQHLEFMIENRRKYYRAVSGQGK